uniref:WGS project CAEQ00000000 data, annotated contig 1227 n=1 Tax=Trypanosoma congolense (strain IL3000) TaxID=1068625 RepID=F9W4T7_TRYCI|nr:unnamed protein product [Trypanosoma congolense IL3000]
MILILVFLFGILCGMVSIHFVFWLAFIALEQLLQRVVKRKEEDAIKHMDKSTAGDAASTPKVESICQMACFDDDVVHSVIPVRAVLFGTTMSVYLIDTRTETRALDRGGACTDRLIAKIMTKSVDSHVTKISKFQRHANRAERCSPMRGTCLVLSCRSGQPLFLVDPLAQFKRRQQKVYRWQASTDSHHMPPGPNVEDSLGYSGVCRGTGIGSLDAEAVPADVGDGATLDCENWKVVLFKMATRREVERWYNLLQENSQSVEWCGYIKRLTCVDTFNLVAARLYFANTGTSSLRDLLVRKIRRKLRKVSNKLPKHMNGQIRLNRLELGEEIPLIDSVCEPVISPNGELEFDFNMLYRGGLTFSLCFNITYRGINVPDITFNVKVLRLSNQMRLSVGPPPSAKVWLSSPQTPHLQLEFAREVAECDGFLYSLLKLLPDMSAIMTTVVKVKLFEDMVLPSMEDFPLPCISYSPPSSEVSDEGDMAGGDSSQSRIDCDPSL